MAKKAKIKLPTPPIGQIKNEAARKAAKPVTAGQERMFAISETNLNQLIVILGEMPAKLSMNAIMLLRQLPVFGQAPAPNQNNE